MSTTTALRKAAEAKRLNVDNARAALDDVSGLKDAAEAVQGADISDTISLVEEYVDALTELVGFGLGVSDDDLTRITEAMETLRDLIPARETVDLIVDTYADADTAVEVCEEHREAERGEYDADTKQEARDDAQEALAALAEAIEFAEPPTETVTEQVSQ